MITLHLDGTSWLHQLRASSKLLFLMAISIGLIWLGSLEAMAGLWLAMVVLYATLGVRGLRRLGTLSITLLPLMAIIALGHWLAQAIGAGTPTPKSDWPERLAITLLQLWALIGLANLVTITTRIQEMVSALMPLLRLLERGPLGRLGFCADTIGLAIGLVIRMVSVCGQHWRTSREILWLRGARRPLGLLLMLTLRQSLFAQERIGEALQLRMSRPLATPPAAGITASPHLPGARMSR